MLILHLSISSLIVHCLSFLTLEPPQPIPNAQGLYQINNNFGLTFHQSLPENYRNLKNQTMQLPPGILLVSPDHKYLLYTRHPESSGPKNRVFIRPIDSVQNSSYYTFGTKQSQGLDYCEQCIKFNKKTNRLYLATNQGILYMCNFPISKSQDIKNHPIDLFFSNNSLVECTVSIDLKVEGLPHLYAIDINTNDEVVAVSMTTALDSFKIAVVESKKGVLTLKKVYNSTWNVVSYWVKWHPIDQEVIVSLWSFDDDSSYLSLKLINTTSGKTNSLNISGFKYIDFEWDISKDGKLVFVSTDKGIYAFEYENFSVSLIDNIYPTHYFQIKLSQDGESLIGYRRDTNTIELLQIKNSSQSHQNSIQFTLKLLLQLPNVSDTFYSTPDNNQILAFNSDPPTLLFYRLCPPQTYLAYLTCLPCSENCLDCYFSNTTCFQCTNKSYILQNSTCSPCSKYLENCSACDTKDACLTCMDFYFLSEKVCKLCDTHQVCRTCDSQDECKKCNSQKGYEETPVNFTCECKSNYSLVNFECIECGVAACLRCEQKNKCSLCDSSKGYAENPENGLCKCRPNYTSSSNQKCVLCEISNCIKCEYENRCVQCESEKYELIPEGKCIWRVPERKDESDLYIYIGYGGGGVIVIIIAISIAVYCRNKANKKKLQSLIEEKEEEADEAVYKEEAQLHEEWYQGDRLKQSRVQAHEHDFRRKARKGRKSHDKSDRQSIDDPLLRDYKHLARRSHDQSDSQSVFRRSVQQRRGEEERRSVLQRMRDQRKSAEPQRLSVKMIVNVIEEKEKAKYSDEEKIRIKRLQNASSIASDF